MSNQPGSPPLTDRVKRALKVAREEQKALRHPIITAEHVLLGLLADKRALSSFVLRELKVDVDALDQRIRTELKRGPLEPTVSDLALLGAAPKWVSELTQNSIGTEHVFLAMVSSQSQAARWLAEAGVTVADVLETTRRLLTVVQRGSGPTVAPDE